MRRTLRRGFTLIEVLLALLIFGVVIVAIIEATTLQVRTERLAEDTSRAVMLADNVLEEIKLEADYFEEERSGEFEEPNEAFDWEYQIDSTTTDGLWKAIVTVTWNDGQSERSHTVERYLATR